MQANITTSKDIIEGSMERRFVRLCSLVGTYDIRHILKGTRKEALMQEYINCDIPTAWTCMSDLIENHAKYLPDSPTQRYYRLHLSTTKPTDSPQPPEACAHQKAQLWECMDTQEKKIAALLLIMSGRMKELITDKQPGLSPLPKELLFLLQNELTVQGDFHVKIGLLHLIDLAALPRENGEPSPHALQSMLEQKTANPNDISPMLDFIN